MDDTRTNDFVALYSILEEVEQGIGTGDGESLDAAEARLSAAQRTFEESTGVSESKINHFSVVVATLWGHLKRAREQFREADDAYLFAHQLLMNSSGADSVRDRREAGLWTYRGLSQVSINSTDMLASAVQCFETAISIRSREEDPGFETRWSLAAAWMNRGDALGRLPGRTNLEEVIVSNEKAEKLLDGFSLESNTAFRTRLAMTLLNRGEAYVRLSTQYGGEYAEDALASFGRAVDMLREGVKQGNEESRRMLAVALTNLCRSRLVLFQTGSQESSAEAREALQIVTATSELNADLILMDLTCRVVLCRSLENPADVKGTTSEMTDLVEEGLARAMSLVVDGVVPPALCGLVSELFRCGADVYRRYLPRFLAEYLLDHLDPERGESVFSNCALCHEVAVESLWTAIAIIQEKGFSGMGSSEFDREADLQTDWNKCRERLAEIRSTRFTL